MLRVYGLHVSIPRNTSAQSETLDDHIAHLENGFTVISGYCLKEKISRCQFAKDNVELYARIVSSDNVAAELKIKVATRDAQA